MSRGQAIVEILFALAMSIFLVMGLIAVVRIGLSNASFSEHKLRSTFIAQEGIELARVERDSGNLADLPGSTCCGGTISGSDGLDYTRTMFAEHVNGTDPQNGTRITVEVSWNELGTIQSTYLTTILYER